MDYFKGNRWRYPDYLQLAQLLIQRGHYYSEIVKRYTSPGSLLDIGCGAGFVMKGFSEEGWKVKGIEPNNEMSDYANKYFGFHVTAEPLEKHEDENTYDLITMIQVVAHFYDVRTCIDKAAGMLKPNGMLLIETRDRNSITAKLMGHAWHEYLPPSVLNWFTPKTLIRLCEQFEFCYVVSRKTIKKIQIGHAISLLSNKSSASAVTGKILSVAKLFPKKWTVLYPADDLFYVLFKKSWW